MIYNVTSGAKIAATPWMGPNINIIKAHMIASASLLQRKGTCRCHTKRTQDAGRSLQRFPPQISADASGENNKAGRYHAASALQVALGGRQPRHSTRSTRGSRETTQQEQSEFFTQQLMIGMNAFKTSGECYGAIISGRAKNSWTYVPNRREENLISENITAFFSF